MLVDRIKRAPAEALAAVDCHGNSITYGELRVRSRALESRLGPQRRLVLLEGTSTIRWLIAYVACLLGRHPVLIVAPDAETTVAKLRASFQPDVILRAGNDYEPMPVDEPTPKNLHPDLAVLLSTSGSTGSAKCVRLSHGNISANAASICEYLSIGSDERGVANLPTHYSYGLSVVNSHLFAGATVLLTDRSVIEPEFWEFLRIHAATSFQGVPHVYDLLSRIDFATQAPESLRYFTQAGGRLAAEKVRAFDEIAQQNGWRFYVMYGQTEATARMAYMPAAELRRRPGSIGVAIPGGKLTVVDEAGKAVGPGEIGQLVYEGPNVMMGYATGVDELGFEPMPPRLATGDLARFDREGYFEVTGRQSRFLKIFGKRIGLDDIEQVFSETGIDAVATGIDEQLLVVTRQTDEQAHIAELLASVVGLTRNSYSIRVVDEYPLTANGKIDYQSLRNSIAPDSARRSFLRRWLRSICSRNEAGDERSVSQIFLETFGEEGQDGRASFRSLGGDSLTYFSMSLGLEARIRELPSDWDTRCISELCQLEQASAGQLPAGRSSVFANVDTLRGLACLMVVFFHVVGLPDSGLRLQEGLLRWLVDSLEYFRMPLFAALAGVFYAAVPVAREGVGRFLAGRFALLIVPALCITPVYWGIRHEIYGINEPILPHLLNGYLHLWFLYALMLMLVAAVVFDRVFRLQAWGWGLLVVMAPIVGMNLPRIAMFAISDAIFLFCFFSFGVFLCRVPQLLRNTRFLVHVLLVAIFTLWLQQLEMQDVIQVAITYVRIWDFIGGVACVGVMMVLMPRIRALEAISIYTYTIYLWHPMANAGARYVLQHFHIESIPILAAAGFLAGAFGPIALHIAQQRIREKLRTDYKRRMTPQSEHAG